jgi:CubicO group peptidase (beta-lactamase class C family)
MISLAFLPTWGQSGASGCRTINHWQLGARKPHGARLFGVFALVQIGFKFPFGERRIGEFGRKARDAPDRRAGVFREAQPADIAGNLIASGAGFATLRDYAKLGVLYLQNGMWDGERLLPQGWADYAFTTTHTGTSYAACFRTNIDRLFPRPGSMKSTTRRRQDFGAAKRSRARARARPLST